MAFPAEAGHPNLPNGNFSPVIYSKKVQKAFRKSSVVEDVVTNDFWGEISQFGDSVRIIKEPDITINEYKRGTQLQTQDLEDADFSMIIDQSNYFQFSIDDIEKAHSHVNFMDLASDRAGYKLRDHFDQEVLGYLSGWEKDVGGNWIRRTAPNGTKAATGADADELFAANKLNIETFGGTDITAGGVPTSIPVAPGGGAGAVTSPLQILNRISRKMDQANVDSENRWVVLDPVMIEMLMDEDSKLINADWGGDGELRNGRLPGTLRGFKVYKTNNLPYFGNGPDVTASAGSETDYGVIVAGHASAAATAEQISQTERFRSPDTFADIVRGMQLYGRKILRPEGLFSAIYNVA